MNQVILRFELTDPPMHGAISINGAKRVISEATERTLSQKEALLLKVLIDVLAVPNVDAGRLKREVKMLVRAHRKGNDVDFWATVDRLCALMDHEKAAE